MASFYDMGMRDHVGDDNDLLKLEMMLDWSKIRSLLSDVHGLDGPTGYDVIKMFKCLLLSNWHSLSDPGMEKSLRVRLDFLEFTGFSLGDQLPDETTFCRFRNKLIKQGKYELLLNEINRQLESLNLKVENAEAALVDATIIEANARPRKVLDEADSAEDDSEYEVSYSSDPDARWLKKGSKSYFGYQGFAVSDEEGFIDKVHVTPANLSEQKELENLIKDKPKGTRIKTDKGFASKANREMLKTHDLKDGLMYRAYRNTPLTKWQRNFNKIISKTRWRIEQCFGNIKRRFTYKKASYFTTPKVNAQFTMKAICHNLLKALNKIELA